MTGQTELDQALEISLKTRNAILFGNSTIEKNLQGFYTVAQILGREKNMRWAKSELQGYASDYPDYRKNVVRNFFCNQTNLDELLDDTTLNSKCPLSVNIIEKILDEKQKYTLIYVLTETDFKHIKDYFKMHYTTKNIHSITKENTSWEYNLTALNEIINLVKLALIDRLNEMIAEITYGKIPKGIFQRFQNNVNAILTDSNSSAISALNIAYEGLGQSEDPERISNVAFGCRRLIKAVADQLFPPQEDQYKTKNGESFKVREEQFLNRLQAYVDSVDSPNRKFLVRKIQLLRDLYGEVPESINKGTHSTIKNSDAEMLVIYTYIILGDIILEKSYVINE